MKKTVGAAMAERNGYEITVRRDERSVDFYSFFYGDEVETDACEEDENGMTGAEHGAFLKSALLLFAGAVGTVLAVLLI